MSFIVCRKQIGIQTIAALIVYAFCAAFCAAAQSDGTQTHIVQRGETLYSISRSYGVSLDELCSVNGIQNSSVVKAGQRLSVPQHTAAKDPRPGSYTVEKGDTLYSLARTFGITVDELRAYNDMDQNAVLQAGQTLRVPVQKTVASASELNSAIPFDLPEITDPRPYSAKKGDSSLVWPVSYPDVSYIDGKISGVQLSAKSNESVKAIAAGTVMFSGIYRGFGEVVFIRSADGYIYVYTGLGSITVAKGDSVASGGVIGSAGIDAISGKPQLTFMVFKDGNPIDPAAAPRT